MRLIDADEIVYESIDSSDTEEYFAKYGTGILAVRKEDVDAMPTVEPHWIPVTERLPDVWADILFCDIDGDVYAGHRTRHGDFYPDFDGDKIKNVVAWMPMPAPWKGE